MKEGNSKRSLNNVFSFAILILWGVIALVLVFNSPSLTKLVTAKGGIQLPNDYSSKISSILKNNDKFNSNDSYIAIFHSNNGINEVDKENIKNTIETLKRDKDSIYIKSIVNSFDTPELKSQLVSDNDKTIMALITIDPKGAQTKEIKNAIASKLNTPGVSTYLTGEKLIESDVNLAAQSGLNKTQNITVVFIFIVLILLFRSIVTPFIPLLTVGISYLVAQSIVAILANKYNFPLSNYTQIFMICIMFGIGTDYSILLLNRFKSEIAQGKNKYEAVKITYKTAGKTVLSSAIPVFVVFASLNFIEFNLYRSAVAVAIGIVFLIIALFTIFPSVMIILGKNIFWPVKKKISVEENKLWGKLGNFAFSKPMPTLIVILVITVIPILFNNWNESFNNLNEIGDTYSAKEGFNIVADDFGIGKASPVSIYIENDDNMKKPEYIALIEKISNDIENSNKDITSVLSVTRPTGTRLDEIYVNNQAGDVYKGVNKANGGLNEIKDGLNKAGNKINSSKPKLKGAEEGTERLQDGTLKTKKGVDELQKALNELVDSINLEHNGATELKYGVDSAKNKLDSLKFSKIEIENAYNDITGKVSEILNKVSKFNNLINDKDLVNVDSREIKDAISSVKDNLNEYLKTHPEAKKDKNFQKFKGDLDSLDGNANNIQGKVNDDLLNKVKDLNGDIKYLNNCLNELNSKKTEIMKDLNNFNSGIENVENGLTALDSGLSKSLKGGQEISGKVPEISDALTKIAAGQEQIENGFKKFSSQINELSDGLKTGSNGIQEIQNGLRYANGFINDWSNLSYNLSGICVPVEIFSNSKFKESLNQYMSEDGNLAVINVITTKNPYSNEAVSEIPILENVVKDSVKGTHLENANIGVGGIASTTYETKMMAQKDYDKALIFVIIGVSIALVIILRSLVMPIYLMASLILTYFTSISIIQFVVEKIMGYPGISWITSFFGFVVLMALGIDYSIFIMTRFNQDENSDMKTRIVTTMRLMGGVILSAVIILSGTFAALIPSGVLSLVEISMVVLTGIVLYVVIILPLFIPAMVKIFGKANWWPFKVIIEKSNNNEKTN